MLKCVSCDPLAERELRLSGKPQGVSLVTQFFMRVQGPPSWCRSDSISPRPATGPQRSAAGINGGPWQPHAGYPVEQASTGSASEGVMSHRNFNPAQEADTLEPKRHRRRRRQPKPLTGLHCHITRWRAPSYGCNNGNWERSNPPWPSVRPVPSRSRCQPDAMGEEDARRSQGQG